MCIYKVLAGLNAKRRQIKSQLGLALLSAQLPITSCITPKLLHFKLVSLQCAIAYFVLLITSAFTSASASNAWPTTRGCWASRCRRVARARGLVHYPRAGQRQSRDASRDRRAGPRIVVITSQPDTIDNDHWYSNSWETENAMNQSTWSASQPCQGGEGRWPMRMGGEVGSVPGPESTNERRRKLGTNWEPHSMWSHVGTSESVHQMANGPRLRLSTRSRKIAQPPSSSLSCNCHRPRPPYGGCHTPPP